MASLYWRWLGQSATTTSHLWLFTKIFIHKGSWGSPLKAAQVGRPHSRMFIEDDGRLTNNTLVFHLSPALVTDLRYRLELLAELIKKMNITGRRHGSCATRCGVKEIKEINRISDRSRRTPSITDINQQQELTFNSTNERWYLCLFSFFLFLSLVRSSKQQE